MKRLLIILITGIFISSGCFNSNAQSSSVVVLETNQGLIEIKLMPEVAPKTCENFLGLVKKGFYDGIIFHRVI